jgi:hypothetical protein
MTCPGFLRYVFTLAPGVSLAAWLAASYPWIPACMRGPDLRACPACVSMVDLDDDGDVDLLDYAEYTCLVSTIAELGEAVE